MNSTIKTVVFWIVIGVSALLLWQVMRPSPAQQGIPEISYSQFMTQVEAGDVARVTITGSQIQGIYRAGGGFRLVGPTSQGAFLESLREKNVEIWFRDPGSGSWPLQLLGTWAPLLLLATLWFFMIRQMQRRSTPKAQGDGSSMKQSLK
jgi:cell division protease FtsH